MDLIWRPYPAGGPNPCAGPGVFPAGLAPAWHCRVPSDFTGATLTQPHDHG